MPAKKSIKRKICLIGEGGVGKTSLIKRFVFDQFSDGYLITIGTKITKKEVTVKNPTTGDDLTVTMMIWDIMGQKGFREILREAYFFGAQGAMAVCDITRKETLDELEGWIQSMNDITRDIPLVFIGNKCDLTNEAEITFNDVKDFASKYEEPTVFLSSAKTGVNVNLAFKTLADKIAAKGIDTKEDQLLDNL
ncbi:MAG: GTP-binding protein [Thermoplasmata archaeon]|nr:MAG: GTP-binding protein [Thermoplasmata archaeon]